MVPGGSREYIRAILAQLGDRLTLHLNAPVQRVSRDAQGVTIHLEESSHRFDQVILPVTQPALAILDAPSAAEQEVLGDIGWQRNEVVLHSDPRWLPVRQRAGPAGTTA